MNKSFQKFYLLMVLMSIVFMNSCSKDEIFEETNGELPESLDTIKATNVFKETSNWLGNISGNTKISNITLPGTHNSCARNVNIFAECQNMTIWDQLTNGVRFLDIRCRTIDNKFTIHHGIVYLNINFDDVLNLCELFLQQNPSEFIFMSVDNEYNTENSTLSFNEIFDNYLSKRDLNLFYLKNQIPVLNDVRGKIVILNRFDNNEDRGLNVASGWNDNATFTISTNDNRIRIQDQYVYKTFFGKTKKWDAVSSMLNEANCSTDGTLFLNFTSATGLDQANLINTPKHVANDINPLLLNCIKNKKGNYGTIIMDYPSADLIKNIILTNY